MASCHTNFPPRRVKVGRIQSLLWRVLVGGVKGIAVPAMPLGRLLPPGEVSLVAEWIDMSEIIMVRRGGKGGPMQMDEWYLDRAAGIAERAVQV